MMAKNKVKDDGNTKSKKNNASPASISGSVYASGLRRSVREASSRKQATASASNSRRSGRIEKQTSPIPSLIKKKPERIEKPVVPSPLRRSNRNKKHFSPDSSGSKNLVEVPGSSKITSTKEKIASSSQQTEGDVGEDKKMDRQDHIVGGKKRKRIDTWESKELFKPQRLRIIEAGASGDPSHNESQSSYGDHFWSLQVRNETSFHDLLKPTVSKLCNVLNFSENVKITVERFLKFVLENYHVSKEYTSALQAFMISLCWIGSSLSNCKIDRKESFGLAKKHLNFSCMEEEANSAYLKLEPAKETFLQNPEKRDAINDCITEPIMSHSLPLNPQGVNVQQELAKKDLTEIEKFKREWEEMRVHLENDYQVDKALICTLHRNPPVRSEKLKSLDNEFANKLQEHERLKEIRLKELKAMMLATEQQITANHDSSLHETRRVPAGDSKRGAQDSPKEAPTSFGNLIEVPTHDKPIDVDNNVAGPDAAVSSVPIEEIPAQQHDGVDDDVAGPVDSLELGVLEADVNRQNAKGGTSSPDRSCAVEDCKNTDPSDMTLHVEMGKPARSCNSENVEDGTINPDTSHAVADQNDSCCSISNSPCTAGSSDHSMPTVPDIQNESLQQLKHRRILDKEGQADPISLPEIDNDNLQPVDASQLLEDGANPSDQTMLQSERNLEESFLVAAETSLGEHMPHLPSSAAVHDQPSVGLHNPAQNPEAHVTPLTAEIPNYNTSRPKPNLADVLQAEMERLCAVKDHVIRSHEDTKQRLKSECEKEMAEMIVQINVKYEAKLQDAELALHLKKKELDMNLNRVLLNKILAEAFRSKCHNLIPGHTEQVSVAGLMQQQHGLSSSPMRPSGSSEIRTRAPQMRPSGGSEYRAPAPRIHPFRPPSSASSNIAAYQRLLPTRQVTNTLPLLSPSNAQPPPPLSTPSPPRAPPQSTIAPPSLPPHHPAVTSQQHSPSSLPPHSSSHTHLPQIPSSPTCQTGVFSAPESEGPPLTSSDAARWPRLHMQQPLSEIRSLIDSLDLTEFIRESSATAPPSSSGHDLICLSDDD